MITVTDLFEVVTAVEMEDIFPDSTYFHIWFGREKRSPWKMKRKGTH